MAEAGPSSRKSNDDAGTNKELAAKKKSKKIVDYNSSDDDSKDVKDVKPRVFEINQAKDYYCHLCRAEMNSDLSWNNHIHGKRHAKNMRASNFGAQRRMMPSNAANCQQVNYPTGPQMIPTQDSNETAQVQQYFDNATDEPIVGLDFVKEIWLLEEFAEPLYNCSLCKADCQRITIFDHVIGSRHRMNYLAIKDEAKHNKLQNSTQKKSIISQELSYEAHKMEKMYGRGFVKVAVQVVGDGDYNCDNLNVEDMDVEQQDRSSSVDDDDGEEKRAHPASKPKSEVKLKEKKKPKLSIETRVKGMSPSALVNKFAALSEAERLQFLENFSTQPRVTINEKVRAVRQLKEKFKVMVNYVKQGPQRDQYVRNTLKGDFNWSSELIRKWTSECIFRKK